MVNGFNEYALEMAILELFEQHGYSYVNGARQRKHVAYSSQPISIQRNVTAGQKPIIGSWRKLSSIKKLHRSLANSK